MEGAFWDDMGLPMSDKRAVLRYLEVWPTRKMVSHFNQKKLAIRIVNLDGNRRESNGDSKEKGEDDKMLNALVRQIDEILSLPYSTNEYKNKDVPPWNDNSWLGFIRGKKEKNKRIKGNWEKERGIEKEKEKKKNGNSFKNIFIYF